jgi:hypothetical protein
VRIISLHLPNLVVVLPLQPSGVRFVPRLENKLRTEVAQSVGLWCLTTDWTNGVRFPAHANTFFLASGAHPASCQMGTGGPFSGAKVRPGRDADNSPPSSAETKNE